MNDIGLPDSWNEYAPLVLATKLCIGPDRKKVRFMLREELNNPTDSGWVFFSGLEPDGYNNNPDNFDICPLSRFIDIEPSIEPLINSPIGSAWERPTDDSGWIEVVDFEYGE